MKLQGMSLWVRTLIFVITAVANYVIFCALAQHFGSREPAWMATLIMVSMVVHECAHAYFMSKNGLRPLMFFAVILGGAMPTEIKKFESLSWSKTATIVIAGPFSNLVLIGLGGLLHVAGFMTQIHFEQWAAINAILMFMNLLPFGFLDGGRFAKLLFNSVPEDRDMNYARLLGFTIIATVLITRHFVHDGPLFVGWFAYLGLIRQATHDDPQGSHSKKAMTRGEQIRWSILYAAMMVIGIVLTTLSPNWMN